MSFFTGIMTPAWIGMLSREGKEEAGSRGGSGICGDGEGFSLIDEVSAFGAAGGAEFDEVVGGLDDFGVVFDDEEGVAGIAEAEEGT